MRDRSHTQAPGVRGYTLIELLLVVGLLGLAGALLVPQIVGQDSMRVQAAVRQVIADLSFAQSDSLAHQENRRVHFYGDGRGYCIVRNITADEAEFVPDDYISDPLASAGELGRYIVDFTNDERYDGVSITSVQIDGAGEGIGGDGADLVYDPLGGTIRPDGLPGTGGTIVVAAGEDSFLITVQPFTGKLTIDKIDP